MNSTNIAVISGNLVRDPELKFLPSGQCVANFSVAVNKEWVTAGNQKQEKTYFIGVVAWGKLAEACGESLVKGNSVLVQGELNQDTWEDKASGGKREKTKINAATVTLMKATKLGPQQAPSDADPAPPLNEPDAAPEIPF